YRKERYGTAEINGDEKGRMEAQSLYKLLEENIEVPEAFKAGPIPLKIVLKYLTDSMNARGKDFEIAIDKQAFKDAAAGAGDILDENIEFPTFMRKMPLAVALRLTLSQITTADATYMIRRNY